MGHMEEYPKKPSPLTASLPITISAKHEIQNPPFSFHFVRRDRKLRCIIPLDEIPVIVFRNAWAAPGRLVSATHEKSMTMEELGFGICQGMMKPTRNNMSLTSMKSARKSSSPIHEGKENDFPRIKHHEFSNLLDLEMDAVAAMMSNMTPEEAAALAAKAVAEAEEAVREAEIAEAEALAAEAHLKALIEEVKLKKK